MLYLLCQNKSIVISRRMDIMNKIKANTKKLMRSIIEKQVELSANSTTCVVAYQPKVPVALKNFSKIENDK